MAAWKPEAICCFSNEKLLSSRSNFGFLLTFSSGSISIRLSMLNFRFGFLMGSSSVAGVAVSGGEIGFGDDLISSSVTVGGETRR